MAGQATGVSVAGLVAVSQPVSQGSATTSVGLLCGDAQSQGYSCADSLVGEEKPESLDGKVREPGAAVRSPGSKEPRSVDLVSVGQQIR